VAHVHDLGDGFHGQTIAVGLANGSVAFIAQLFETF
jgi:hypothetical protein